MLKNWLSILLLMVVGATAVAQDRFVRKPHTAFYDARIYPSIFGVPINAFGRAEFSFNDERELRLSLDKDRSMKGYLLFADVVIHLKDADAELHLLKFQYGEWRRPTLTPTPVIFRLVNLKKTISKDRMELSTPSPMPDREGQQPALEHFKLKYGLKDNGRAIVDVEFIVRDPATGFWRNEIRLDLERED